MDLILDAAATLPDDGYSGTLLGRAWLPRENGPSVVVVRGDGVWDISAAAPTMAGLLNAPEPLVVVRAAPRTQRLGSLDELLANTAPERRDPRRPWLLAPIDLQAIKAAGVTFAQSLLERVVESRATAIRRGRKRSGPAWSSRSGRICRR